MEYFSFLMDAVASLLLTSPGEEKMTFLSNKLTHWTTKSDSRGETS